MNDGHNAKAAKTPAFGEAISADMSNTPLRPSKNRTRRRKLGNASTLATRQRMVGLMVGVTATSRACAP